jgi:glyceraldehyde 3-phosphate dehydrogenase
MESNYELELKEYINQQKAAVELTKSVGNLLFEKSIELVLFRNHLVNITIAEILNLHIYAHEVVECPIDIYTTSTIAKELENMDLAPAKLDVGRLANEWLNEQNEYDSMSSFLSHKLRNYTSNGTEQDIKPKDVVLYGFGRIGRLVARELIKQAGKGQQLRLRAIVTRNTSEAQLIKRTALLRNDSVHGAFEGTVRLDIENKSIIINGQIVRMIEASNPEEIDYTSYGINNALLIDNTGIFKDRDSLGRHLQSKGVSKVLLTAPAKGDIPNIVYGINHSSLDLDAETIFSAASCTTNAITPVLKTIEDEFEIVKGHVETIHAYTNDQNLLDNMHKSPRRGRSAAINMVITSTGAGAAATKVVPSLKDKLTANAVRVPTPNGSLAIMNLNIGAEVDVDTVNKALKKAALEGRLVNQIHYSIDEELVSNDIIGNSCPAVFDSKATLVSKDRKNIVLYTWYDNEFGYTKQVMRLAKYIAKVGRLLYY